MIEIGGDEKLSARTRDAPAFADVVGQEELKRALLAVATDDDLDGLLVRGEKGTAKSTLVRALAAALPEQRAVADCPFSCPPDDRSRQCSTCRERATLPIESRGTPLVTLPLGASRERVVGTLSVADALDGDRSFDPGLLARANRGILYVDEVNLLDDHLVDVLLDAAAEGRNRVERDGVSVTHPAAFTLIGTMNPEEGDLRPQLRDRFALSAEVTGCADIDDRVAIVDRALGRAESGTDDTGKRLRAARDRLPEVRLPRAFTEDVAEICRAAGVDGHRADIAAARTARAFAALDGRETVLEPDVRRATALALAHRMRSRPFEDDADPEDVVDDHFEERDADEDTEGERAEGDKSEEAETPAEPEKQDESEGSDDEPDGRKDGEGEQPDGKHPASASSDDDGGSAAGEVDPGDDQRDDGGDGDDADRDATPLVPGQERAGIGEATAPEVEASDASAGAAGGTRSRTRGTNVDGPRVRTRRASADERVDAAASVRAAAARGADGVESRDLRQSVREADAGALVTFVVDASASMRPAMRRAKGTVLELLKDAYRQRDEVAFVTFAGEDAEVLLPPTDSVTLAARHLKDLPTGDRTPLPAGLDAATDLLNRANPEAAAVVLVTDGRANASDRPTAATRDAARRLADTGAHTLVVDAGEAGRAGLVDVLSEATDGERVPLSALSAERVDRALE